MPGFLPSSGRLAKAVDRSPGWFDRALPVAPATTQEMPKGISYLIKGIK